jgi:hypothetical protein
VIVSVTVAVSLSHPPLSQQVMAYTPFAVKELPLIGVKLTAEEQEQPVQLPKAAAPAA